MMSLNIFFSDDIANTLSAIDEANLDAVTRFPCPEASVYRQGFAAALTAVATAFGVRVVSGGRGTQLRVPTHLLEALDSDIR